MFNKIRLDAGGDDAARAIACSMLIARHLDEFNAILAEQRETLLQRAKEAM